MLIEIAPLGARRVAVVGVGLNVLAQTVHDAASGVAWLAEVDPDATPATTLERIVAPLVAALRRFESEGFAAFAERFAARDLLLGRRVCAGAMGEVEGIGDILLSDHLPDTRPSARCVDPQEQRRLLEGRWEVGGGAIFATFADLLHNEETNHIVAQFCRGEGKKVKRLSDGAPSGTKV